MIKKYVSLELLDKDYKYLNNIKKQLYFETNNPSFNIMQALCILGETHLQNFKNINLLIENPMIEFETNISIENESLFINSINNNFIQYLKNELCIDNSLGIYSNYLSFPNDLKNYPFIYLGKSERLINKKIDKIEIKDIRLNIFELIVNKNEYIYKKIDSIHLSMDKVLLDNNLCN